MAHTVGIAVGIICAILFIVLVVLILALALVIIRRKSATVLSMKGNEDAYINWHKLIRSA